MHEEVFGDLGSISPFDEPLLNCDFWCYEHRRGAVSGVVHPPKGTGYTVYLGQRLP